MSEYKSFFNLRKGLLLFGVLLVDEGSCGAHCTEDGDDSSQHIQGFEDNLASVFTELYLCYQDDPEDDGQLKDSTCAHLLDAPIQRLDFNDVLNHSY